MNTSLAVTYKGTNGRFASLNEQEVISHLTSRFVDNWTIYSRSFDKSHTKAAQKCGGGSKYWVTLRKNDPVVLRNGDVVYPQIQLRDQTYSGGALQVSFGLYRLVCTNGLMGFKTVVEPVRVPHFKNKANILMQLVNIIESSADRFAAVIAAADELTTTVIRSTPGHIISQLDLPPSLIKKVTEIIQAGLQRKEDDVNTVYGLYNLINEVDRTRARKNSTAFMDRDERLLGQIIEIARAA